MHLTCDIFVFCCATLKTEDEDLKEAQMRKISLLIEKVSLFLSHLGKVPDFLITHFECPSFVQSRQESVKNMKFLRSVLVGEP